MTQTYQIQPGDEVFIPNVRGRGGHGAFVIVTKINPKSIKATERERSYTPGTRWTIGANQDIAICAKLPDGRRIDYWATTMRDGLVSAFNSIDPELIVRHEI